MPKIEFDYLDIRPIKPEDEEGVSKLDCTEDDGSDPLGVQEYLRDKALIYHREKVSTVYRVKDQRDGRIIAFFTLSMTNIESKELEQPDKLDDFSYKSYPAVHLGQMGIDRVYRGQKLGREICYYCIGLAITLGEQIACRYIVLRTDQDKSKHYKKWGFRQSNKTSSKGRFWMYRRLTPLVVALNEPVHIVENVVVVLKRQEGEKHTSDEDKERIEISSSDSLQD